MLELVEASIQNTLEADLPTAASLLCDSLSIEIANRALENDPPFTPK
jgi:hypothetical protein